MKKIVIVVLGCLASITANAQNFFGNEKEAFYLMPAQVVASGPVSLPSFSHSARLVAYRQELARAPESLLDKNQKPKGTWFVYDRVTKVNRLLRVPAETGEVRLLADDRHALFSCNDEASTEGFIDLETNALRELQAKDTGIMYLGEEPYAPYLIGVRRDNSAALYYPSGKVQETKGDPSIRIIRLISGDANQLVFIAEKKLAPSSHWLKGTLNLATLKFSYTEFDKDKDLQIGYVEPKFWVRDAGEFAFISIASVQPKPNPTVVKAQEPALIPAGAKIGPSSDATIISGNEKFVLYQDAGALLMREIRPISTDIANQLALEALKKELLNRAKQMGTAFMIYGADYDDVLPGQEGWEAKLSPYVKNRNVFKDFNYTYKGGDISKIENPAGTEMGFILGPGGRAVVYMDGSAKWVVNP